MFHKILYLISIISLFSTMLFSCGPNSAATRTMDQAEAQMEEHPDSALAALQAIDVASLSGSEQKARHALLLSMALDKNYIDTTTFDVLQPAIDYYLQHGTADEKLRTLYYQGRIFMNQGDDENALQAFLMVCDNIDNSKDSLTIARALVAQGNIYVDQYQANKFADVNIQAARIYNDLGLSGLELDCYSNAIDGALLLEDKKLADSLLYICDSLTNDVDEDYLPRYYSCVFSYIVNNGSVEDIKELIKEYEGVDLPRDDSITMMVGYVKIGENEKALDLISQTHPTKKDSLRYYATYITILENMNRYNEAYEYVSIYTNLMEKNQNKIFSQDVLFANNRHKLKAINSSIVHNRNTIVFIATISIVTLIIIIGVVCYLHNILRRKKLIIECENENLKFEQDTYLRENEDMHIQLDATSRKLNIASQELDLTRQKLDITTQELDDASRKLEKAFRQTDEIEKEKALIMEMAEGLRCEIKSLEKETERLRRLLSEGIVLSKDLKKLIRDRLDLLNGLLAKEISNNAIHINSYLEFVKKIKTDRDDFLNSTRLTFYASYPLFMNYLNQHNLTTIEINYVCLSAMGLLGKEIGEYIQLKRHYVVSCTIRKKLDICKNETNLGIYIRKLMAILET